MVGDFLQGLGGNPGDSRVAGLDQLLQHGEVPRVVKELLGHGDGKVTVGLLDQQQVAVGALVTAERQGIGIPAIVEQLGGILQPVAGLADQIEADVHQGQLFLDGRGTATPFAEALALDQGAVAEQQQVGDKGFFMHGPPHMCPTSSGSS
ncbi:hypothetical protein D3C75_917010 [compost metagenome]